MPRMGGFIIFCVFIIMFLPFTPDIYSNLIVITASFIICLCGVYDDIHGMKWNRKFLLQFIASILLVIYFNEQSSYIEIFEIKLYGIAAKVLLVIFVVGVINALNLLDGLDGLVSGYSFLVLCVLASLAFYKDDELLITIFASLIGSLVGFMKFNAYPAKIFLGDTGSLLLGFFLAFTSIKTSLNFFEGSINLTFPVMLLGVPVIDTLRVMILRIIKKNSPFSPDNTHLHHVIRKKQIRHKTTVLFIHAFTIAFALNALYYIKYRAWNAYIIFSVLGMFILLVERIMTFIRSYRSDEKTLIRLHKIQVMVHYVYRKSIAYAAIPPAAVLLYFNFPIQSTFTASEMKLLFVSGLAFFITAYLNKRRNKVISPIYIYFNLMAFLFINTSGGTMSRLLNNSYQEQNILIVGSITVLCLYITIFLGARILNLMKFDVFLNGMELTLLIFTVLLYFMNSFISNSFLGDLSLKAGLCFLLYLSFRIIGQLGYKVTLFIYYFSFILPLAATLSVIL